MVFLFYKLRHLRKHVGILDCVVLWEVLHKETACWVFFFSHLCFYQKETLWMKNIFSFKYLVFQQTVKIKVFNQLYYSHNKLWKKICFCHLNSELPCTIVFQWELSDIVSYQFCSSVSRNNLSKWKKLLLASIWRND